MTSHTNNDEYATYIKSLMESVWSYDTSADETRDFEVNMISKMQDAGFKLNSVRQFTDELEKPELDVLFVSRE